VSSGRPMIAVTTRLREAVKRYDRATEEEWALACATAIGKRPNRQLFDAFEYRNDTARDLANVVSAAVRRKVKEKS